MTKKFYVKPAFDVDMIECPDLMTVSMEINNNSTTGNSGITGGDAKMQTTDVWGNGSAWSK